MNDILKVKDIMTEKVVVLRPGDSLEEAVGHFEKYDFDGFPVVDENNRLTGILTAYDLVNRSSAFHMQNLVDIINKINSDSANESELTEHYKKMNETKVQEVMNADPLIVTPEASISDLANEFASHHRVNPIPVIDEDKKLLGVVSRYDIIRFFNEEYLGKILKRSGHSDILKRLTRINDNIK